MANKDRVIGFTDSTGKKGWRVDFDPEKGLHVNETDYVDKNASRKICHGIGWRSDQWAMLWWKKFTSAGLDAARPAQERKRSRGPQQSATMRRAHAERPSLRLSCHAG